MKRTYADAQVAVYDDVLPPEGMTALWDHLQRIPYQGVHARAQQGVWRIGDGNPLQGSTVAYSAVPAEELAAGADVGSLGIAIYPTGTALDGVIAAITQAAPEVHELIGAEGTDWLVLTGSPWLYPAGTRLSWHEDAAGYSGAFVFYAHPAWNVLWGGELLIAHESVRDARRAQGAAAQDLTPTDMRLDNQVENAALSSVGVGRFIVPKPNRLVFVAAGTPHMIAQVTGAAGDHVRASIAGFFVNAAGVESFLRALR